MKYLLLWLLLIPQQKYEVELVSCGETIVVSYDDEEIMIEPFNVMVLESSKMCQLLESATQIIIESEPNIRQDEVVSVWIFLDGSLLQERLIVMEEAKVIRNHPFYTYQAQLRQAQKTQVVMGEGISDAAIQVNQSRGMWMMSVLFVGLVISVIFYHLLK